MVSSDIMPNLSESTEAGRVLQALIALQKFVRGATKAEACEEAGISVWQFEHWIGEGGPVIEKFQETLVEQERVRMVQISSAQGIILNQLIKAATAGAWVETVEVNGETRDVIIYRDVKPGDQLKILKYLDGLRAELESKYGVKAESDAAGDYLTGPKTQIEQSKMLEQHEMSRSSVNVKPQNDGSVDITFKKLMDPIDVTPTAGSNQSPEVSDPESQTEDSPED